MSNIKKICSDSLKYDLLNILRKPYDEKEYVRRRQLTYKNLHQFHKNNDNSDIKLNNLYALMYSKYYTQRYIISELNDYDFTSEDDVQIKQSFKDILKKTYINKIEFENAYLDSIKRTKEESQYKKFEELNTMINTNKMNDEIRELFYIGTTQTDIFLEKKLIEDIDKFKNKKEKTIEFLNKYKFINGWITSIGIFISGIIWTTFKK